MRNIPKSEWDIDVIPPATVKLDRIEEARNDYRRAYRRHEAVLSVLMAVAGGMLGGSLVLQFEMWRVWLW